MVSCRRKPDEKRVPQGFRQTFACRRPCDTEGEQTTNLACLTEFFVKSSVVQGLGTTDLREEVPSDGTQHSP